MPDALGNLVAGEEGFVQPGKGLIHANPSGNSVQPLATPPVGYTPATAAPTAAASKSYTPTGTVVLDRDTVQGQLDTVLAKDSKLLQRADVRSRMEQAGKGLINSSMAVQAGQAAVIDAALPIAQQDAQTHFTANTKTVDAENASKNFGAAADNQASLANAQLATDVSKTNAGMINEASARSAQAANEQMIARLDADTRTMLANLDATTKTALATMDAQNRQLLQGNQNAANMFQQTVTDITNISTNEKMSKAAKDAAVATALNLLREGLGMTAEIARTETAAVSGLDLSQYFVTAGMPAASTGSAENIGNATPIPGTNPLTSQWSDGQKHSKPSPGTAIQVQGIGWWGSDGKFYGTQADAINLKNPLTSAAPPDGGTGTPPPPTGGTGTTPPPTGGTGTTPPPTGGGGAFNDTIDTQPTPPPKPTGQPANRTQLLQYNNGRHKLWLYDQQRKDWVWVP